MSGVGEGLRIRLEGYRKQKKNNKNDHRWRFPQLSRTEGVETSIEIAKIVFPRILISGSLVFLFESPSVHPSRYAFDSLPLQRSRVMERATLVDRDSELLRLTAWLPLHFYKGR